MYGRHALDLLLDVFKGNLVKFGLVLLSSTSLVGLVGTKDPNKRLKSCRKTFGNMEE